MISKKTQNFIKRGIERLIKEHEICNLEHERITKEIEQNKKAMLERSKNRRLIRNR